jgi:hypothetical protein
VQSPEARKKGLEAAALVDREEVGVEDLVFVL